MSSKLKFLKEKVQQVLEETDDKMIIFSHFIGFISMIQMTLHREGIEVLEFKGTMSNRKRAEVIDEFNQPNGPRVLVISIKAGGVGLNLTAANWVFLMEPWWNPAFEQQALDRVYRIGQKKAVSVLKFICSSTIEERIKNIQSDKDVLAHHTLQLTGGSGRVSGESRHGSDTVNQGVKQNIENIKKLFI